MNIVRVSDHRVHILNAYGRDTHATRNIVHYRSRVEQNIDRLRFIVSCWPRKKRLVLKTALTVPVLFRDAYRTVINVPVEYVTNGVR
jgi:hypothetical protein